MKDDNVIVQSSPPCRKPRNVNKNQAAVLAALFSVYDMTGICPSYRELATLVGLGSPGAVLTKITVLERRGLVTRTHLRRSRNILVTEKGKLFLQNELVPLQSNSRGTEREVSCV